MAAPNFDAEFSFVSRHESCRCLFVVDLVVDCLLCYFLESPFTVVLLLVEFLERFIRCLPVVDCSVIVSSSFRCSILAC